MKIKEEIGVMLLQTQEYQTVPANHQKLGEMHGTNSLSQLLGGIDPTNTLIVDLWPLKL